MGESYHTGLRQGLVTRAEQAEWDRARAEAQARRVKARTLSLPAPPRPVAAVASAAVGRTAAPAASSTTVPLPTSSSSAIGGVGYHASPEASEKGGESTAVTSLREVDVRHFVAPLQPQRNGQQIGKNELSVVLEPLHVVRDFALPVHGESAHAVQ